MGNRRCYQCGGEDLAKVQARRKTEVRAWAAAQIADADRELLALVGVPTEESSVFDDEDLIESPEVVEVIEKASKEHAAPRKRTHPAKD